MSMLSAETVKRVLSRMRDATDDDEQDEFEPCPFCGSDDIGLIDQSLEKVDGNCVAYDAAECNSCCAQAPVELWKGLVRKLKRSPCKSK